MNNNRSEIYKFDVDLQNENDARALIGKNYVSDGATILDVGCACGDLAVALHNAKNVTIVGMEYDQGSIDIARQTNAFENIHQVDLNNFNAADFKNYYKKFDHIIFADVLEHVNDPQNVMETFKVFLKNDGSFLVSFPNISHASIKMNLLIDDWTYTDTGILDRTHIKFFTYKSIAIFLAEIGLKISEMKYTALDRQGCQPNKPWEELPSSILRTVYKNPHSFVVQYVLKVKNDTMYENYNKILNYNIEKLQIKTENTTHLLRGFIQKRSPFRKFIKFRNFIFKK